MTTKLNEQIAQGGEKAPDYITREANQCARAIVTLVETYMGNDPLPMADCAKIVQCVGTAIDVCSAQAQQRIQELEKGLREKAEVAAKEIAKISVGLGCTVGDCNHGKVSDLQAIIARSLLQSSKT